MSSFAELLTALRTSNPFYQRKLVDGPLSSQPFTTKAELIADQLRHPPYGSNLTESIDHYVRMHQTSGTMTGATLRWLDTSASWQSLLECWKSIYGLAGVTNADCLFFPFSFGPFLGFWTAFDAAGQLGCLVIPGGGLSSTARLQAIRDHGATVVLATPTYALHLAEVAEREGMDLAASTVRLVIVAGEPGGNIPSTRQRIEAAWGARLIDHYGLTEVGPVASECIEQPGSLHIVDDAYIAEVIDPDTLKSLADGEAGELVLTNLHRSASPLIRYRTGDMARLAGEPCPCGRTGPRLVGGILGRADDMIQVRGNNVYPTALEDVVRRCEGVDEFRVAIDKTTSLTAVRIDIEPTPDVDATELAERLTETIRAQLMFRPDVAIVPAGSLPRSEFKSKRVVRTNSGPNT